MKPHENSRDADTELELFRQHAEQLGFGRDNSLPGSVQLESSEEFIARMTRTDQDDRSPEIRNNRVVPMRWTRRRRLLAATLGLAATAALVFGVTKPGGSPAAADAPAVLDFEFASAVRIAYAPGEDARQSLDLLAAAAMASADMPPGDGQIQYKRFDNWNAELDDNGSSKVVPRLSETWLRPDGSLTTHEAVGQPLDPDGRVASGAAGKQIIDETLKPGTLDADFAQSLPTDPPRLVTALLDHSGCESRSIGDARSMCLYREIVSLTQNYVFGRDLTAAIWKMLENEAGFRSLGSVSDRAGRDAIGLSIIDASEPHVRHLLFGNPGDGQIVGYEEILIKRDPNLDTKPPSVLSFSTVLDSRLTSTGPR